MDIILNYNSLSFIILCIFGLAWLIQMLYLWGLFSRLAFFKKKKYDNDKPNYEPVSVIVCAKDAYEYLIDLVPRILSQDYPDFELVIVNDCSTDETTDYLKELVDRRPDINVVSLTQSLNFFHGKKFPLSMGIKSAKHDLLLLTDADCLPENDQWIKGMVSAYKKGTEVVLGYGPYFTRKGLLNKLIRFDTLYTAIQYLSMALAKMPYMGVGRNLSYHRDLFYKNKGFTSHYTIPSGDDDIFISQVANKKNTRIFIDSNCRMESEPKHSFGSWIRQKRRHYSTANMYKPRTNSILGTLLASRVFYYASLITLLCLPHAFDFAIGGYMYYATIGVFALLHYVSMDWIYIKSAKQLGEKNLYLFFTPFYDVFFTIFTTLLGIRNTISKPKSW
ncbi:MAG: glycosyltransferase [Bacteroidales bacterium]|nr:glycosyltransferase [Bacteroidales bacterium]MBQ3844928.1 glycosyltransferase [Bacteroidales bacterium]